MCCVSTTSVITCQNIQRLRALHRNHAPAPYQHAPKSVPDMLRREGGYSPTPHGQGQRDVCCMPCLAVTTTGAAGFCSTHPQLQQQPIRHLNLVQAGSKMALN